MTDQQILAGPGEIAEGSKSLGLNLYAYLDGTLQTVFSSPDMGQGPGAVAWLTGNFFGPAGVAQIAQLWNNNGNLGLNVYGGIFPFKTMFSAPDLGQGSGALAFLTGDFTGSGNDEIAQLWDHNGNLGVIGYGIVGVTPQTVFESPDLGQGSGALAFLAGDFTGSGHTQIGQLWEDNGNLGLIVYGYVNDSLQTVYSNVIGVNPDGLAFLTGDFLGFGNTQIAQLRDRNGTLDLLIYGSTEGTPQLQFDLDMDQGPAALAFLAGNFTGSGHTEIAQLWNDNGDLGLIVYGYVNGTLQTVYSDTDLFEGSGALAFLAGDFTGSGHTQIGQLWEDNGNLGLIVYGYVNDSLQTVYSNVIGVNPDGLAFLTGDFLGFGNTQIAQLRDRNGTLDLLIYGSTEGTPQLQFDLDMDQGPAALAFLAGNFTGSGHTEIAQLWNDNGDLGLIVYGYVNGTLQTVYSDTDLFEGSGALAFLAGDFTGSGYTQIAQPWDNDGNLGLIVYGNDGLSSVVAVASSPDLGQGSGALAWLAGTFVGPNVPALIAQPWDN